MTTPASAAEEVRDPRTSPQRLLVLTEHRPDLHQAILEHPNCPQAAKDWILVRGRQQGGGTPVQVNGGAVPVAGTRDPHEAATDPGFAPVAGGGDDWGLVGSGAAAGAAGGTAAGGAPPSQQGRERRRTGLACGGCAILALILVVAGVLIGNALRTGGDSTADSGSTTSAEETTPEEESSTAEETTEEETTSEDPVSPAPDDAVEVGSFASPTGNIRCSLEEDSASCTVVDWDYGDGEENCADADTFAITVAGEDPSVDCGGSYGSTGTTLEYGTTSAVGDMACTSESDGMTCWNVMTGHGFMVNRSSYDTF